jgi:molybdopterin-binding protein
MAKFLAVVSALALGAAAVAGPAAAAPAGSISGTVTDSTSAHSGIANIYVCALGLEPMTTTSECGFTEGDGDYVIDGLGAGEYVVWFRDESAGLNYVSEYYDDKPTRATATKVVVGSGPVEEVDAELASGGQITGTVTDVDTDLSIEGVEACAPNVVPPEVIECDRTDENGEYAINSLASGSYTVEFSVEGSPNYVRQYYNLKPNWFEAEPVAVTAGAITPGIDAEMEEGVQVTGTITEAGTGDLLKWLGICALDPSTEESVGCASSELDGSYSIAGLPPGEYVVGFAIDHKEEGMVLHPDGYVRQYFDLKPTFAAADPVGGAPGVYPEVDATLSKGEEVFPSEPSPPAAVVGPLAPPLAAPPAHKKPLRCKKGFHKKKVKGKPRCVKNKRGKASRRSHR